MEVKKKFTQKERLKILEEARINGVKVTSAKYNLSSQTFYYWKHRTKILQWLKERYATDKIFREKTKKTYREKYRKDKDYRRKTSELSRNRYHIDPKYRQKTIERNKSRLAKLKLSKDSTDKNTNKEE